MDLCKLDRNILFRLSIKLNIHDLLRLCQTNKYIIDKLYNQNLIWNYRTQNDFQFDYLNFIIYPKFKKFYNKSSKDFYIN